MPALAHQPGRDARLPTIGAAPPFSLTTADGGRLALADMRGKVVAVTFIYATCTDTCPLLTAKLAGLGRGWARISARRWRLSPSPSIPSATQTSCGATRRRRREGGGLGVPHRDAGGDQGRGPALRRVCAEEQIAVTSTTRFSPRSWTVRARSRSSTWVSGSIQTRCCGISARSSAKAAGDARAPAYLPRLVARIPAAVHTKLLVAFLTIVGLLIALGAVGLRGSRRGGSPRRLEVLVPAPANALTP